jgi:DNA-binding LytR/AlgR family response regulator
VDGTFDKLYNFSFKDMVSKGLDENNFLRINQSCRVNRKHILQFEKGSKYLMVACPKNGNHSTALKISDSYFTQIKESLKGSFFSTPKK